MHCPTCTLSAAAAEEWEKKDRGHLISSKTPTTTNKVWSAQKTTIPLNYYCDKPLQPPVPFHLHTFLQDLLPFSKKALIKKTKSQSQWLLTRNTLSSAWRTLSSVCLSIETRMSLQHQHQLSVLFLVRLLALFLSLLLSHTFAS